MYYKTNYKSPVGNLTLACDVNENLIGVWFEGQKYFGGKVKTEMELKDNLDIFKRTKNWLDRYFEGEKPEISELALAPVGTEFSQKVWKILCGIPYGEVCTYGEIAKKINKKMSAQAIGGAIGHNPISIIIPCHRVIGANGSLTGYAAGINIKTKLLIHEGIIV